MESLRNSLRGRLVLAEDPPYEELRMVYNAMHDRKPAGIVQASDTADVVAAVNHARNHGLAVAVRGGGHSVPGYGTCDGGLVIDMAAIGHVLVRAEDRTVQAGGGATLAQLDHATHAYGLAVPGGTVSSTGLAGLTLGGGMGHLSRRCGLTIDNLLTAEVVTSDGQIRRCSETHEPDLFWAIRGGGGNFGVVTSFTFRAFDVPTVLGGPTMFEFDAQVIRNYQALISEAPRELNAILAFALSPPAPFVPDERHGTPVIIILACWCGDQGQDESWPARIAECGNVVGQGLWRMPYPEMNRFFDELLPRGLRHYWKSAAFSDFPDGAIAAHLEHGPKVPTPEGGNFVFSTSGAVQDAGDEATAYANRGAGFSAALSGIWHDAADDEANIAWVREYYDALEPFSDPGAYINFMSGVDDGAMSSNFGAKYRRLREIKSRYDPENMFRYNQNISPA